MRTRTKQFQLAASFLSPSFEIPDRVLQSRLACLPKALCSFRIFQRPFAASEMDIPKSAPGRSGLRPGGFPEPLQTGASMTDAIIDIDTILAGLHRSGLAAAASLGAGAGNDDRLCHRARQVALDGEGANSPFLAVRAEVGALVELLAARRGLSGGEVRPAIHLAPSIAPQRSPIRRRGIRSRR